MFAAISSSNSRCSSSSHAASTVLKRIHASKCSLLDCTCRKALAVVGVSLKGEKAFRTALLNQLHDECREGVFAELKSLLESPNFAGIFICSDGWRCKSESTGRPRLSAHTAQRAGALQS
eukprot:scaffold193386_cov17-Tisochrysis_lutea.AAC.1